jgi:hypothetical protein
VVEHRLTEEGLDTTTEVEGDAPVALRWHEFLAPAREPRERWRVALESRTRIVLDDRVPPTGEPEPWAPPPLALGGDRYGEALADIEGPFVLETARRRIEAVFFEGAEAADARDLRSRPPSRAVALRAILRAAAGAGGLPRRDAQPEERACLGGRTPAGAVRMRFEIRVR